MGMWFGLLVGLCGPSGYSYPDVPWDHNRCSILRKVFHVLLRLEKE